MRPTLRLIAAVLATLGAEAAPSAGTFQTSATRIDLSATTASALFSLTNTGGEELRFQIVAYAWDQAPGGEMKLEPTQDLVVFPTLFTVPAGGSRAVRVGTTAKPGASERSYRIFVEELPPMTPEGQTGVRVLTRMGIPVFLAPARARAHTAVHAAARAGKLDVVVENGGTVHVMLKSVRVVGLGAGGEELFAKDLSGWYLLAGGKRVYTLDVPAGACPKLRRVTLKAQTDASGSTTGEIPASAACAAPGG
jgi:fimbrial chaperone protein